MANKKVSQLTSKPSVLVTDLFPIADPSTGQLYKTTISDLGTAIGSGVSSVNGLVGSVVLDTDDIQELVSPTNKWFTDTRARAAISAGTGISYNSGTGVITNAVTSGQIATALGYTPADDSLVVKLAGSQTITGVKTFDAIQRFNFGLSVKSVGGANQGIFGNDNGFNFGVNAYTHSLLFPNSGGYNYTLPATTGTIALTSDLSAYALDSAVVKLTGNQTVAGQKTFSSTLYGASAVFSSAVNVQSINVTGITASPSVYITTNGTNHAVSIVQSGAGYAIYASGNVAVIGTGYFSSSLTAASLASTAGYNFTLPSASGTLALTSNLSSYLPLSGGTLTGALSGTSATFSTTIADYAMSVSNVLDSSQGLLVRATDNDGDLYLLRLQSSNGATSQTWVDRFIVAKSGAATFSSSVTASKLVVDGASAGNVSQFALTRTDSSWGIFNETDLRFYQSNSNTSSPSSVKMVITSAGNVGIGTTAPAVKLEIQGASNQIDSYGQLGIITTDGQAADKGGQIMFGGFYNGASQTVFGGLSAKKENSTSGNFAGYLQFITSTNGVGNTEKMRITSGGGLLIGKTSSAGTTYGLEIKSPSGDYLMHFTSSNGSYSSDSYQSGNDGTLHFRNGSCDVYLPRTAGTWVGNSDSTIKENINLIDNSLNKLMQLNGYTYNLIDDKENSRAGLLAQEVEAVLPEAVHTTFSKNYNRNIKGVEYDVLIPLLVNSIKELKAELDTLKNK
jgi:hypothetical protein